jgi:predicted PhzF superfamily epimerase YddE/YHI9
MDETRKTSKRATNRIEKIKIKIKIMALQKNSTEGTRQQINCMIVRSNQELKSVQWVSRFFMPFVEVTEETVRVSDRTSLATCVQGRIESTISEKVRNLVRNNKL